MDTKNILGNLRAERERLDIAIRALEGIPSNGDGRGRTRGRRRSRMSAAGKARIAAAQRARWAKVKAKRKKAA